MTTIYVKRDQLPAFIATAHGYNGNQFKVEAVEQLALSNNYWGGGSKTEYMGVNLATGQHLPPDCSEYGNPFVNKNVPTVKLQPGFAIVAHSYFQGKDMGLTVYVHPENMSGFITQQVELSEHERKVLYYTRSLKSSYAGIKNYRQAQSGLSPNEWEAAKQSCISRKLLNKAGAITTDGRNAIGDWRPEGRF